jgi:hypothetical protein
MSEAYRRYFPGHHNLGRNVGRGCRQQSKIVKALKGLASLDLLDAVARADARLKRNRGNGQGGVAA